MNNRGGMEGSAIFSAGTCLSQRSAGRCLDASESLVQNLCLGYSRRLAILGYGDSGRERDVGISGLLRVQ